MQLQEDLMARVYHGVCLQAGGESWDTCAMGVPSQELIQNQRLWGGPKEQSRSLILVALNVDPSMLCVHVVFGHISSIFFSFSFLFPLKFNFLLPFHPLMSNSFCTEYSFWIFIISASSWLHIVLLGPRLSSRRRQWRPTPVLLPGKSHRWRSLVGCSPWGR